MRNDNLLRLCLTTIERLMNELPEPHLDVHVLKLSKEEKHLWKLKQDVMEVIGLLEDKVLKG